MSRAMKGMGRVWRWGGIDRVRRGPDGALDVVWRVFPGFRLRSLWRTKLAPRATFDSPLRDEVQQIGGWFCAIPGPKNGTWGSDISKY
jgi:hypothetical protein